MNAPTRPRLTPDYPQLRKLYTEVRRRARQIKREAGTLYEAYPFRRLAGYAVAVASDARIGRPRSRSTARS